MNRHVVKESEGSLASIVIEGGKRIHSLGGATKSAQRYTECRVDGKQALQDVTHAHITHTHTQHYTTLTQHTQQTQRTEITKREFDTHRLAHE